MFEIVMMFILWNWGLTPLWVNITCTVLLSLRILFGGVSVKIKE